MCSLGSRWQLQLHKINFNKDKSEGKISHEPAVGLVENLLVQL